MDERLARGQSPTDAPRGSPVRDLEIHNHLIRADHATRLRHGKSRTLPIFGLHIVALNHAIGNLVRYVLLPGSALIGWVSSR